MKTKINSIIDDESLDAVVNLNIIIRFHNGRTIAGLLRKESSQFSIKLGVLHIPVFPPEVTEIILA